MPFWILAIITTALIFTVFYGMFTVIDEKLKERLPETTETVQERIAPETAETEIEFDTIEEATDEGEIQPLFNDESDTEVSESSSEIQPIVTEVPEFYADTYAEPLTDTPYVEPNEDDVMLLARLIMTEAGADYCTDAHQRAVASVLLNHVASPYFPNTIHDCIFVGWYDGGAKNYGIGSPEKFYSQAVTQRAIDNARYVLTYGSTVGDAIYQAEFIQGEIVAVFDYGIGLPTYICR